MKRKEIKHRNGKESDRRDDVTWRHASTQVYMRLEFVRASEDISRPWTSKRIMITLFQVFLTFWSEDMLIIGIRGHANLLPKIVPFQAHLHLVESRPHTNTSVYPQRMGIYIGWRRLSTVQLFCNSWRPQEASLRSESNSIWDWTCIFSSGARITISASHSLFNCVPYSPETEKQ